MPKQFWLLFVLAAQLLSASTPTSRQAPIYSAATVLNAATNQVTPLAPNGIFSLYGRDLAFVTRAIGPEEIRADLLPTTLQGTGVRITIENYAVPILFVSPSQINFIVPPNIRPGRVTLKLFREGIVGPGVVLELADAAPGLFQFPPSGPEGPSYAIATTATGALIDEKNPAKAGEVIILYANGLGQTDPRMLEGRLARAAAWIAKRTEFRVTLQGSELPAGSVLYAGLAPGFAGLYQINLRLPETLPQNAELLLTIGAQRSAANVRLFTQP